MPRRRGKITRVEGSVIRGKGNYVIIGDKFSIDTTHLTGCVESSLEGEFYNGQWHVSHKYKAVAGRTTEHSAYANLPEFKNNKDVVEYLKKLEEDISTKKLSLDKLSK